MGTMQRQGLGGRGERGSVPRGGEGSVRAVSNVMISCRTNQRLSVQLVCRGGGISQKAGQRRREEGGTEGTRRSGAKRARVQRGTASVPKE